MRNCSWLPRGRGPAACVVLLIVILCLGCQQQAPPPPPTPAPPPQPSPEKIKGEIDAVLAPMQAALANPAAVPYTDELKKSVLGGLQTAYTKNRASENGKQALAMVASDLETIISKARDAKRWGLVLGAIEAYEILSGGSTKMNRLKERAQLYLNRPVVTIQGFYDDKEKNETIAFLQVKLPNNKVKSVQKKPGDEFEGLRFLDFVGDKKGVRLEYLAIPGDTWEVMKGR
jgi:hypothetical protein